MSGIMRRLFPTLFGSEAAEDQGARSFDRSTATPSRDEGQRGQGVERQVVPGYRTQYTDSDGKAGKVQLVVGFDFGTAFTKVVIAEQRRAYAVPLNVEATGGRSYLLPAVLAIGDEQQVYLGNKPGVRHYSDLKMRILDGDTSEESQVLVAAFMAMVLRRARAWFMTNHRMIYKNHELDWYVNVGLPTEHYHDERLTETYRSIANAAWLASTQAGTLHLQVVRDCLADDSGSIGEDAIGLFPEFVAQITGYVRSPMRRPDLHLLMDVGAGTVDVAVFNVHKKDGEDVFPVFAKSVGNLGVHFLHKRRAAATGKVDHPFTEGVPDEELARHLGIGIERLRKIDGPFRTDVYMQVRGDVLEARRKYPLSRHWDSGIPFFLCGGGANVELYSQLAGGMIRDANPCRLVRTFLQKPDRLVAEGLDEGTYDRLSVAYGLSFNQYDIGEIVRSHQIEDVVPASASSTCRRCNGTGGMYANSCTACGGRGWID